MSVWITGAGQLRSLWHLGRKRELRGEKTGKLIATYYVAACNNRQLGGAWGYARINNIPDNASICPRCLKLSEKE